MAEIKNSKRYDLEDRTLKYSKDVLDLVGQAPITISNSEVVRQLVRSSTSVGANYIEANGSLGKKDFAMRIRICRKEAKESRYWLILIKIIDISLENKRQLLINESEELLRIFNSILVKIKS